MTTKKLFVRIPRAAKGGDFVRLEALFSGSGKLVTKIEAAKRLKHVRTLSTTEKRTIAYAEQQLRHIASSKISAAQRLKAQELADKARNASESQVTAKFRRIAHAA